VKSIDKAIAHSINDETRLRLEADRSEIQFLQGEGFLVRSRALGGTWLMNLRDDKMLLDQVDPKTRIRLVQARRQALCGHLDLALASLDGTN